MKAFRSRLEQVMRWRASQVEIHRNRVAAAGCRVSALQAALEQRERAVEIEREQIVRDPVAESLEWYAVFAAGIRHQIQGLRKDLEEARRIFLRETDGLVAADRRLRLLENLEEQERECWQKQLDRETAAFADEAFLGRVFPGRIQSKKRMGA